MNTERMIAELRRQITIVNGMCQATVLVPAWEGWNAQRDRIERALGYLYERQERGNRCRAMFG